MEWKTRAHDRPADVTDRLLAAGFVPEDRETVVVAAVDDLVTDTAVPDGVRIRETDDPADMRRIAAMEGAVWGRDQAWLGEELVGMVAAVPRLTHVVVAEALGPADDEDRTLPATWSAPAGSP